MSILSHLYEIIASNPQTRIGPYPNLIFKTVQSISTKIYEDVFNYTQYLGKEQINRIQNKRLSTLIDRARNGTAFYKEYFKSLKSIDDFPSLKPISKYEIRDAFEKGTITNPKLQDFKIYKYTSGSTGIPLSLFRDRNATAKRRAIHRRIINWVGRRKGDLVVQINRGVRPELESEVVFFLCDGPQDLENKKNELCNLLQGKTIILFGMASNLIRLAQLIENEGIKIEFRAIISDSEALHPEARPYLVKVFQAPVFNLYGSEEVPVIAQECEFQNGLHVNSEWVHVEIVNEDNQNLPSGEMGDIILSSFDNEVMPFIKYKIGDKGYWLEDSCPCGRNLPRLKIEGRILYSFKLPDGRTGDVFNLTRPIYSLVSKISQYQIIRQEKNRFAIKLIPLSIFTDDDKNFILNKATEYLGTKVSVSLELVDKIENKIGGKPQGFINLCQDYKV